MDQISATPQFSRGEASHLLDKPSSPRYSLPKEQPSQKNMQSASKEVKNILEGQKQRGKRSTSSNHLAQQMSMQPVAAIGGKEMGESLLQQHKGDKDKNRGRRNSMVSSGGGGKKKKRERSECKQW